MNARVLVAHTDLLAQIAGGVPEGVKVLAVPTPPEIAAAYNVPPEKRAAPAGVELWRDFVAASPPRGVRHVWSVSRRGVVELGRVELPTFCLLNRRSTTELTKHCYNLFVIYRYMCISPYV